LKSLEFASGRVDVICDAPAGFGGTWGPDGTILFSPSERSPIYRVPAQGGTPSRVTTLDAARHDAAHRWPHWLSDGQHFIFMPWTDSTITREIQLASIDGGPTRTLFKSPSAPVAAGGYFFYVTDVPPRLAAQAYDPSTFALIGQPFAIVADDNVDFDWMSGFPSASASADTLVYTTGKYRVSRLTWVDRSGRSLGTIGEPGSHFDPRIAPNGRMATFEKYDVAVGSGDVCSADLVRGAFARLTFAPGFEMTPVWSPDGSRLAFASDQGQAPAIYLRKASGAGAEELVFTPEARSYPTDWSSDGRHLLFMLNGGPTGIDVWQYDWERRAASPVVATRFNEGWATFSPDGRWMAYVSDEDQQRQVYVQSYPDGAVKAQVSTRGGASPQWRGDGKELYYLAPDNTMMAVPVQASRVQFTASAPQPLFTATVDQNKSIRNVYSVTPDGQRFLLVSALDLDRAPLVAALNWRALARR
jgi:Tol biopolymer transport system component